MRFLRKEFDKCFDFQVLNLSDLVMSDREELDAPGVGELTFNSAPMEHAILKSRPSYLHLF